ncbi:MAG: DNA methyltransferase [Promethearchaeota archaeon]
MQYKVDYSIKEKYGFIPVSILKFDKNEKFKFYEQIWPDETHLRKVNKGGIAKPRGGGILGKGYDYSKFNFLLAEFLIKKFTKEKELIFNPFGSRGVIGIVANILNRDYIGTDISPQSVHFTIKNWQSLLNSDNHFIHKERRFDNYIDDATKMAKIKNDSIDHIITCPPYFNVEEYESVPGQLSDYKKYSDFIRAYRPFFKRAFEVLKDSKPNERHFLILVTGNFRYKRELVNFTAHNYFLAKEVGFKLWDEIILFKKDCTSVFTHKREEVLQRVARIHETIQIFLKNIV